MESLHEPIIEVAGLGKSYQVYDKPQDRLKQALFGRNRKYYKEFWALRDIDLAVSPGESYGIIGRNGSGKSTLLQLICGTISPTVGTVKTRGKIAALLELGSGFNPEFTGIENVYLNASMLGLEKSDIDQKLDSILAFAEIGDFINQPVKTYSSGMAVRLAFAVIAHVDADILVVDEALAVGDTVFVQRCMKFIRRMRDEKCLLFVSHDAWAVKSLCSHALWLSDGNMRSIGECKSVALDYLRYCQAKTYGKDIRLEETGNIEADSGEDKSRDTSDQLTYEQVQRSYNYEAAAKTIDNLPKARGWKTGDAELISVSIKPVEPSDEIGTLKGGEEVEITIIARSFVELEHPVMGFTIANRLGQYLVGENTFIARDWQQPPRAKKGDTLQAVFRMWFPMLPAGEYALMASIADGDEANHIQHHWTEDAVLISVSPNKMRYGLVGAFINHVSLTRVDSN